MYNFLEAADRLGISTPLNYGSAGRHTPLINAAMNDRDVDLSEEFPHPELLPSVALAQRRRPKRMRCYGYCGNTT